MSTTAGALAARLGLDTSGFVAGMQGAGTVSDRELKRIQRQVQYVSQYVQEMTRHQTAATGSIATMGRVGAISAGQTANAMRQLPAQFTDIATQLAGGQNPMLILLQQGGQIKDSFGGVGNAIRGLSSAFSPVIAVGAAAVAVVGGFAYAAYQGGKEAKEFGNSLTLTGNAAGITAARFAGLADSVAKSSGGTIGEGRETLQALISTGRFYPQVLGIAAQASQNLQRVSGKTAEEVAKDFASMSDDVAKWVAEHNKHMHFVSVEQFAHIKRLQDQGKVSEAAAEAFKALNGQFSQQASELGVLERAWKGLKVTASEAWDAMKGVGRASTTQQAIEALQAQINTDQARLDLTKGNLLKVAGQGYEQKELDRKKQELSFLKEIRRFEEQAAANKAREAQRSEAGIKTITDSKVDPKAYQSFIADLAKYNMETAESATLSKAQADADKWAAEMRKRLAEQTEHLTVVERTAIAAAIPVAATQRMLMQEEMDARKRRIERIVADTANEEAQRDKVRSFLDTSNELVKGILQEADAVGLNAEQVARLTKLREVDNLVANATKNATSETVQELLMLAGVLRNQVVSALEAAEKKKADYAANFGNGVKSATDEYIKAARDQASVAANLVTGTLKRAEDAFINFAKTGKLSLRDVFGFMAEEYLRSVFRMQAAKAIEAGPGGLFSSLGSIVGTVAGFFGFGHRDGLDYVPYDGYPAILHKGERVQTSVEASGGRGGKALSFDFSGAVYQVGQGVSRSEMHAAVNQGNAQTEMRVRRLLREGVLS